MRQGREIAPVLVAELISVKLRCIAVRVSKKLKKTLVIVCIVLVAVAAAVTVWRTIDIKADNSQLKKEKESKTDAALLYDFEEAGTLNLSEDELKKYIPLEQYGNFYASDNEEMLLQAIEQTFVSAVDCKYYINNHCFTCNFGDGYQYRFFGKDETDLPFYLRISPDGKITQWFIRNGYIVPFVEKDVVSEIVLLKTADVSSLGSHSADGFDLRRINPSDGIIIKDKSVIKEYITRYNDENYVFDDRLDDIKAAKEKSDSGYVLAGFGNGSIYQCIGAY